MAKIHPTAIVEDGATLGADVVIGPYAHVGRDVRIGDGVTIGQGAIVDGHSTIGNMCQIFPYALIGMKTQDLKYIEGSTSYVEIGDRSVIREFTTVHLGTKDGEWFTLEPHTGNRPYRGVRSAHRAIRYVTEEHGDIKLPCLEVDNIGSPYRKEGVERFYIIDHNLSTMGFWYEYLRTELNYKKRKGLL